MGENAISMTLHEKSQENLQLANFCYNGNRCFTAVDGRPYYAVFQRLKHVLKTEKFDYNGFLASKGLEKAERPFSHGTISAAFARHVSSTRKSLTEQDVAAKLVPFQQLYMIRKKADYEPGNPVLPAELRSHIELATQLINYIDRLPAGSQEK